MGCIPVEKIGMVLEGGMCRLVVKTILGRLILKEAPSSKFNGSYQAINSFDQWKLLMQATSASSSPVQVYLPCAGLVKKLKICSKSSKRKLFPQLDGPTRKIFRRFLRPFSKSSRTAAARTNLLILFQESTWHAAFSHFPLHKAMHPWFLVETIFSILEIVSEFPFSAAPCMLHTHSMSSWTVLLVFLARKLKRVFSLSCLWVKAIACRLLYDLILLSRMYSATFLNVTRLVLTFPRDTAFPFDERERLSLPDIRVDLFFALLAFMQALVVPHNISKVRVVFIMHYFLVWFGNVPLSSNVTKGVVREMHVDVMLWFKLLFHWFTALQFGHIDRHMVVNALIFLVFLTTCSMNYLSVSLSKSFCYCWWEILTWWKFFDIFFWVCL